ncbi:uncharacterized protein DS421_7g213880 [Arachis hypogaea]|uniref:GRF-type domain-containing protein n=1 Tax=Arachis hypogaea TaxID=3818 RepID=A0A445CEL2_ARAHY|nr:uncharacterized protein DS421_7g213880 [Arachis hypogaea]RYR49349.1 hypothetical protein Ahy_A07g035821 [Arachis hypogaea]
MSFRRFNSAANDGSRSSSSSSKKMKAKKLDGRCFCGREVTLMESGTMTNPNRWFIKCSLWATRDCKYFVWVDEIEEGWEGIVRCLAKRHSETSYARYDDGFTVTEPRENQQAPSILARKIDKFRGEIRGEIRGIRVLLLCIS